MREVDQSNNTTEQLLTRREVSDILRLDPHTLAARRKELEPVLPIVRLGSRVVRYRLSDVQKLINQGGIILND